MSVVLKAQESTASETELILYRTLLDSFPPVFHQWFLHAFPDPTCWFQSRLAFARSVAAWSMVGFVVGLGDRHGENILIDSRSGDCVHVDFDCLAEDHQLLTSRGFLFLHQIEAAAAEQTRAAAPLLLAVYSPRSQCLEYQPLSPAQILVKPHAAYRMIDFEHESEAARWDSSSSDQYGCSRAGSAPQTVSSQQRVSLSVTWTHEMYACTAPLSSTQTATQQRPSLFTKRPAWTLLSDEQDGGSFRKAVKLLARAAEGAVMAQSGCSGSLPFVFLLALPSTDAILALPRAVRLLPDES